MKIRRQVFVHIYVPLSTRATTNIFKSFSEGICKVDCMHHGIKIAKKILDALEPLPNAEDFVYFSFLIFVFNCR